MRKFAKLYMNFTTNKISYKQTNSFSKLVLDYLEGVPALDIFYNYKPNTSGVKKAIADRKNFPINRSVLVNTLKKQYEGIEISDKLQDNIQSLASDNTFTICTAHQPNIFTGHLYFIYKILHAIKLAESLEETESDKNFVPVYYMGTEDADLDELGEVFINGIHYKWQTDQKGAVGRMLVDDNFIALMEQIAGQLLVSTFGQEVIESIKKYYTTGSTIEQATFHFVDHLFGSYGLIVLLPENANLKNEFVPIITKELEEQFSAKAVAETVALLSANYKMQATGRAINLFYLKDNIRDRIEASGNDFIVANTDIIFTKETLFAELKNNPERFSPNVILRPVYQEMILPNVAFIGGGGELAYWLELKKVFEAANVFFPALILRNSFTIIPQNTNLIIEKLGLTATAFFEKENSILENIVKSESVLKLNLTVEIEKIKAEYEKIKFAASTIDNTLTAHVDALHTKAMHKLQGLEKKMLKAEKKKFEVQQKQIQKVKMVLSPNGALQERIDNILQYTCNYGNEFIEVLYKNSNALEQNFTILTEQ